MTTIKCTTTAAAAAATAAAAAAAAAAATTTTITSSTCASTCTTTHLHAAQVEVVEQPLAAPRDQQLLDRVHSLRRYIADARRAFSPELRPRELVRGSSFLVQGLHDLVDGLLGTLHFEARPVFITY